MKRIIQAMVVVALFAGAQAKADDGDAPIVLAPQWTHADQLPAGGAAVSAFPGYSEEMIVLVSESGSSAAAGNGTVASAFPGSAREDPIVVESKSTYADRFAVERTAQARGASDPALSQ